MCFLWELLWNLCIIRNKTKKRITWYLKVLRLLCSQRFKRIQAINYWQGLRDYDCSQLNAIICGRVLGVMTAYNGSSVHTYQIIRDIRRNTKYYAVIKPERKCLIAHLLNTVLIIVSDGSKIEVEVKSDVETKTDSLPYNDFIEKYGNDILDMPVGQTDMKVRHIFRKFVEVHSSFGLSLVKM